jgi:phage terminase large subunit
MYEFFNVCPDFLIKDFKKTENKLTLVNDSVILFRHLEEPDKLKSLNLGWFAIDEMTEVPEDVFLMLQSRLRKKEVPRRVGFGSTNPEGKDWVWHMFCKTQLRNKKYLMVQAPTTENPHLPEDYVDDLIEGKPEYWINRYIKGDPSAFSGQILTMWDESMHVIEPFDVPADWTRLVVLDHGTNNPTAVLWMAINPEGFWVIYKEHFATGQTVDWHAEQIILKNGSDNITLWLADPAIFNKTLQSPTRGLYSVADLYSTYDLHFGPADNDRRAGVEKMLEYFKVYDKLINPWTQKPGSPKIFITKDCEWTIYELPQWRWKETRVRGRAKNKPEEPEKANDHTVDCTRYGLMSNLVPSKPKKEQFEPFKPREERIWDELAKRSRRNARRMQRANKGVYS